MKYKIVALTFSKLYIAMQNWYFRRVCRAISISQKALVLQMPASPFLAFSLKLSQPLLFENGKIYHRS